MDENNNPLVNRLIGAAVDGDDTQTDVHAALQRMGLTSVFDITRMTKAQFALELGKHTQANADQAYDNAQRYARHVCRLYLEHLVSPKDSPARHRRDLRSKSKSDPASYQALFKEDWDKFCKEGDLAAIDSPVAYLRALYLFAGQLEGASSSSEKIPLDKRRPDLKDLMLDQQSAFVARPMLEIVNHTLDKAIKAHFESDVHQHLATAHYPFSLPYELHHHQCLLGLGTGKPALGELNYRMSRILPLSPAHLTYGSVVQPRVEAQKLLSGLSPEQQRLLLAPLSSDTDLSGLEKSYGTEASRQLHDIEFFKERTGLTTEQVRHLLAQGEYAARASPHSPASRHKNYGAAYINGPESTAPMTLNSSTNRFENGTPERLSRLQKMIRLQRWTGIPFTELDTLITSALRSEKNTAMTLNANTLRTLGVYRYLNRRHGIAPEEFACLLHDIPIHACGLQVPLFDQIFDSSRLFKRPEEEINAPQDLIYLAAGLGLAKVPDSLSWLIEQTKQHLAQPKHDLPTISSFYRQTRIARMFGLTFVECTSLARMIGGDNFNAAMVKGALDSTVQPFGTCILDVLMALDWASDWLKRTNRDVASMYHLSTTSLDELPLDQNLDKRFKALLAKRGSTEDDQHLLENLLHELVDLSADDLPCVLEMTGTTASDVVTAISTSQGQMPAVLTRLLRNAKLCQELHLSGSALQQLAAQPTWLSASPSNSLTLHAVYLYERFSYCARLPGRSEEQWLHYLQFANQEEDPKTADAANKQLAELLGWTHYDVQSLADHLKGKRAQSVEEVDWIVRSQECSKSTGLSASLLLKATALGGKSSTQEWKIVGEAIIATSH
ncbi:Tc toxin subunit A [Pseudomonas sp. T1.Ur]|uniref:Tc toxin subunit A n=1 Tax=Pseudomonas sp. T1.Ur TaxID=2928704 RepID=UPI00201E5E5F|nr:Tc toxin subunit A [Pseudomonas sp. T1.Ur]MCL6703965.1 Tc toxin subunit A [Pseudomonas sp. T1.Ur]